MHAFVDSWIALGNPALLEVPQESNQAISFIYESAATRRALTIVKKSTNQIRSNFQTGKLPLTLRGLEMLEKALTAERNAKSGSFSEGTNLVPASQVFRRQRDNVE